MHIGLAMRPSFDTMAGEEVLIGEEREGENEERKAAFIEIACQ